MLIPAGGAGGPAFGAFVLTKIGVPADLAARRHAALFLITSAVTFVAIFLAGMLTSLHILPHDVSILGDAAARARRRDRDRARPGVRAQRAAAASRAAAGSGRRSSACIASSTAERTTSVELLRHRDPLLIYGSVAYFAFDVASLACVFQAFGGGAPPIGIFILAYSLGHAGAFLPTPGGVGGTEGGLIGMFVAYGTPFGLAAAAVLAYRVFQLGLPAIFGAFALLRVRHTLAHPPPREVIAARFAAVAREDEQ